MADPVRRSEHRTREHSAGENSELSENKGPEHWLSAHGDYLFRFAMLRVRSTSIAEDLVQDTLVSGIRAYEGFKGESSERTWLAEILRNKIIDHFRSAHSRSSTSTDPAQLAEVVDKHFNALGVWNSVLSDWASEPEKHLQNRQFFEALGKCLGKLPDTARKVFVLRVVDGVEGEEICKILGLTSSHFWVLMHRARMALRDCIERNWIQTSS